MDNQVPILDTKGVVRVESLPGFLEVLDAVIEGQWLMVAPRMTLRLQQDFEFKVCFANEEEAVTAIGTPFYWRGPFVGMKVRPASSADLNRARQMSQRLLSRVENARAADVQGGLATGGKTHTSYAMVDSQPEPLFPGRTPPPVTPTIAASDATPEVLSSPVVIEAEVAPSVEAGAEPEFGLPPAVIEPDQAPESQEPTAEDQAVESEDPPPEEQTAQAGEAVAEDQVIADVPALVLPDGEFVPVVPPPMSAPPDASPEASDALDYTETEYIDLDGAAAPILPDAPPPAEGATVAEPSVAEAVGEPEALAAPPASVPPAAQTSAPRPAAPGRAAAAAGARDMDSPIPELRGTTSGGFVDKDLLLTFPDKSKGLSLSESPTLYRLLSVLAAFEVGGQLTLQQGEQAATLFLRSGTLLGLDPLGASFDQMFGDHLLAEKAIEQGPLDEAVAHSLAFDKTLPVALYEKRSIGMDVMGSVLRELKQKILFELLSNPKPIAFHFVARRKFGRKFDPMRVHLAGALVEYVRTILSRKYLADLEPLLVDYKFKYAQVRNNAVISIDVLNLDDKQRHALKYVLHGPNRLNEAYSLCLLTRHGTGRLVMLLHHFGLIDWLDSPGEVLGQETIEDRLKVVQRQLQAGDHFKRLEVHWGAHPRKIQVAYQRYLAKYAPGTALARHSAEAGQLCAEIVALVKESHDFLEVKQQRREYRLEKQGDQRVRRAAEFLVKQADLVAFRGDWQEAFDLLEAAIDMWAHPSFVSKHQQWTADRKR